MPEEGHGVSGQGSPAAGAAKPAAGKPVKGAVDVGYSTTDGDEANAYIQAGGRLVSCVKLFPKNLFKPGKRYTFIESKKELDELAQKSEEGG